MSSTIPTLRQQVSSLAVGETLLLPCGWWLQKPGKRRGETESEGGGFVLLLQKRESCTEDPDDSRFDVVVCNCDQGRHYHSQRLRAPHTLQLRGTLKVADVKQHRLVADSSLWLLLTLHLSQRPTNRCARSQRVPESKARARPSTRADLACACAALAGPRCCMRCGFRTSARGRSPWSTAPASTSTPHSSPRSAARTARGASGLAGRPCTISARSMGWVLTC